MYYPHAENLTQGYLFHYQDEKRNDKKPAVNAEALFKFHQAKDQSEVTHTATHTEFKPVLFVSPTQ